MTHWLNDRLTQVATFDSRIKSDTATFLRLEMLASDPLTDNIAQARSAAARLEQLLLARH